MSTILSCKTGKVTRSPQTPEQLADANTRRAEIAARELAEKEKKDKRDKALDKLQKSTDPIVIDILEALGLDDPVTATAKTKKAP